MIERLDADVDAMRSGDTPRRDALRLLPPARNAEKDARRPLTDDRRRACCGASASGASRPPRRTARPAADRAAAEEREAAMIDEFLPAQLDDADLAVIVDAAIANIGATCQRDMGRVMREAMALAAGRADGKRVQELVRDAWPASVLSRKFADAIAPSRPPGRHTREHRTYDSGH